MDEQYYRLRLWDYGVPSFISKDKAYYGTMDDIQAFIDTLENNEKHCKDFYEMIAAFHEYEAGNHAITHSIAYQDIPLLEPVEVLGSAMMDMDEYTWEHPNAWGCIYQMRCDYVRTEHLWISDPDGFSRVVVARFANLQYRGSDGSWCPLNGGFLGHPKMLEREDSLLYNRLAVVEKRFENRKAARKDMSLFGPGTVVNFEEFCNDIFGDG